VSRREITVELVVALLLLAGASLLYLEWWRSGELELLNRRASDIEQRVDELARARAARRQPKPKPGEGTK